jgi:RHS repeat-associated protein
MGSVTAVASTSGTVAERYSYTAFGQSQVMTASFTNRSLSLYDWQTRFHGESRDEETGFYNYGYRYYDPVTGRWPSRDPLGDEAFFKAFLIKEIEGLSGSEAMTVTVHLRKQLYANFYSFVDNDTINSHDRLGLDRQLNGVAHKGIQIDDWKVVNGKYVKNGSTKWGFGMKAEEDDEIFKSVCKAVCAVVYWTGSVWDEKQAEPVKENEPFLVRASTPCDDLRAIKKLKELEKDPSGYSVLFNNCGDFARGFYSYGMNGAKGKNHGPCLNPDGTLWKG